MTAGREARPGAFDWEGARSRLADAIEATERALAGTSDNAREILETRARALARAPAALAAESTGIEAVTFFLGKERYAIEARYVREVVPLIDFTPVPGTPDFVVGVTNLRGAIVAVLDLRRFFNIRQKGVADLRRVVVLGVGRTEFGMLVDAAGEVLDLDLGALKELPGTPDDAARRLLRGVTEEATVVLDGAALLADARFLLGGEGNDQA